MLFFFSKMKIFTATVLSQNYHWTDGFFLKNHPLKEAEKQYKFCFRTKVDKGYGGGAESGMQDRAVSGQVSTWNTVMQLKRHLHERLPSVPERGSKRLTRPFILCLSSLSSCILQETECRTIKSFILSDPHHSTPERLEVASIHNPEQLKCVTDFVLKLTV